MQNTSTPSSTGGKPFWTTESLKKAIESSGRVLVVSDSKVLDLTDMLSTHPGGELALRYMNGHDATDVLRAFHPPWVIKAASKYYVGEFIATDNSSPSKSAMAREYRLFNERLRTLGFYKPNIPFYVRQITSFAVMWLVSLYLGLYATNVWALCASAVLMGAMWHAASFVVHDAGHHAVTGKRQTDDLIGITLASVFGGTSVGWWKHNHNVHHIVTNHPEHDPDIQHLPFFAVTTKFFQEIFSTFYRRVLKIDFITRCLLSVQHYTFIPVMTLGRFNLYAHSVRFLLDFSETTGRQNRFLELAGLSVYWCWYGLLLSTLPSLSYMLLYLYLSNAATMILHLQITVSHFAMDTDDVGVEELFLLKALRTTMNVECAPWFDWFHGGLQFQIEHHLFPRIPRCYLRKLSPLVQAFCREHDLQYVSYGFFQGNGKVLGTLKEVAHQVRFVLESANPQKRFQ